LTESDHNLSKQAAYSRRRTAEQADVGEIPAVVDPDRREACRLDLHRFLTTYFPHSTGLHPFSADHRRVIARLEQGILHGGRFAQAIYRGAAKTTISENAALWATLYAHRRFVVIIGADKGSADGNIASVKTELETNDRLAEDFPEVCYPVACLEGKVQRTHSQTIDGQLTHIRWTGDKLVFPRVNGSKASGAIIVARGITGRIRGMKHKTPDGHQIRPDFVIIDDPQTDTSAKSPSQVEARLNIIRKAILKLAGHGTTISAVMNGTVICPDDVVDQLCDPELNPAWQSERIPMVTEWSDAHESLWLGDYKRIRETYDRSDPADQQRAHAAATEFYREHRAEMDAGCIVSWAHCYDHEHEISAIQHAYNALIDDGPDVFASEFQNRPVVQQIGDESIEAEDVRERTNGLTRGQLQTDSQHVTAMVDVHDKLLYWMVCGWRADFTGQVIDYGAYPEQSDAHYQLSGVTRTLGRVHPGTGREGAIHAGLERLVEDLLKRVFQRTDGATVQIGRLLIDRGYKPKIIESVLRRVGSAVAMPSRGRGIGAANKPLSEYRSERGQVIGHYWRIPSVSGTKESPYLEIDANYWKSFVQSRLCVAIGQSGALSLFGRDGQVHRLLSDHLAAEYAVLVEAQGRAIHEWKQKPARPDNHWLDCLVGCAAAASMLGAQLPGEMEQQPKRRTRRRKRKVQYL
jgi:hypothetical protein